MRESTPASPDEPPGTRSVLVACFDSRNTNVFGFHAYVRTQQDGTEVIGGSGRPDPKWLRVGNVLWRPDAP